MMVDELVRRRGNQHVKKKKKGKECRLKNLAELIPELIPVRLF